MDPHVRVRPALIDLKGPRLLEVDGLTLRGECLRCGKCCEAIGCKEIGYEMLDGKRQAFCNFRGSANGYRNRPVWCALYPLPGEVRGNCGFYWE